LGKKSKEERAIDQWRAKKKKRERKKENGRAKESVKGGTNIYLKTF